MRRPNAYSVAMRKLWKRMAYGIAALVIIVMIQSVPARWGVESFSLPFVSSEPADTLPVAVDGARMVLVACTTRAVSPVGFPFKANLYDECQQDDSIHIAAMSANVLILGTVATVLYILLHLDKAHHARKQQAKEA